MSPSLYLSVPDGEVGVAAVGGKGDVHFYLQLRLSLRETSRVWRTALAHKPRTRPLSHQRLNRAANAALGSSYDRNETRIRGRSTPLQSAQIKQQALCKRSMLALPCNPRLQEALFELLAATIITFCFFWFLSFILFFFKKNVPTPTPLGWLFQA